MKPAPSAPFDLAQGVKPEEVDLDNITVEQFSVGRKYARPLARQGWKSWNAPRAINTCPATAGT